MSVRSGICSLCSEFVSSEGAERIHTETPTEIQFTSDCRFHRIYSGGRRDNAALPVREQDNESEVEHERSEGDARGSEEVEENEQYTSSSETDGEPVTGEYGNE